MRPTLVRTAKLAAGSCFDENTALDLIGGLLPSSRHAAVVAHAESCDDCRRLLADLAAIAPAQDVAPPPVDDAPATIGRWQLLQRVGSGAAGTVYRARNADSGRLVAIKLVNDQAARIRFEREARALATLEHPGIVRYVEHGTLANGTMYLVMQWLDGQDLSARTTALSAQEVLDLAIRLASALAHAHARGVVHRDLSPKNVFLPGGVVAHAMILDFGLVRWVRPDVAQTASQAIVGTPYYMAPEQIRGVYDIDARADLFALGVLLYEAASGRLPFEGDDLLGVWQKIVHAQQPDLGRRSPHMPRRFVTVVEHLLEKAPSDRPATAEHVLHALQGIRIGENETGSNRAWPWLMGAGAVLVSTVAVGLSLAQREHARAQHAELGKRAAPAPAASALEPAKTAEPAETAGPAAGAVVMSGPAHALTCMRGSRIERGGHYAPPTDASTPGSLYEGATAVTVLGSCKLVLEDCVLEAPSVSLLAGSLTLRRCHTLGDIRVMNGNLILDHSELDKVVQQVGDGTVTGEPPHSRRREPD